MSEFVDPGIIDLRTFISTCDWPVCNAAEVSVVGDYNSINVSVSGSDKERFGAYLYICDDEKDVFVEVFAEGSDTDKEAALFRLVDGKWVNQDPSIQKLQETNQQLVAENERRSAEIASLKSMSIHDRFKALIVEARRLGEDLGYHDGAGWVTIKTSISHA